MKYTVNLIIVGLMMIIITLFYIAPLKVALSGLLITRSLFCQCVHKVSFTFRKSGPLFSVLRKCSNWITAVGWIPLYCLFCGSFRAQWSLGLTAGLQLWLDYCETPWPIRTRAGIMLVLFQKKFGLLLASD